MKKIVGAVLVVLLLMGAYLFIAKPCVAGNCWGRCRDSSYCPDGCACVKSQTDVMGDCVSAN